MPTQIHLPGVPHVFTSTAHLVSFLRFSPGYVGRQRAYLEANHSSALRQAGYAPPKVALLPKVQNKARDQYELQKHGFVGASQLSNARASYQRQKDVQAQAALNPVKAQPINRAVPSLRVAEKIQEQRGPSTLGLTHLPGGHAIAQGLGQIGSGFIYAPAGIYQTVRHPLRVAEQLPGQIGGELRHPGANLGNLALLGLAAASAGAGTVARFGAAGAAAREGGALAAAKALARRPVARPLSVHTNGLAVPLVPFENPVARAVQGGTVKALESRAARNPEGWSAQVALPRIASKNLQEIGRVQEAIHSGPAAALIASGRRLSTPQQFALRIVAEQAAGKGGRGITLAQRRAFHEAHGDQFQARLTGAAAKYLEDTPNGPRIRAEFPRLQALYDQARGVAGNRDELLTLLGRMTPEGLTGRISGPGKVIEGAKFEQSKAVVGRPEQVRAYPRGGAAVTRTSGPPVRYEIAGKQTQRFMPAKQAQKATAGLVGSDFKGGEFRVPYARNTPLGAIRAGVGQIGRGRNVIGYDVKNPPSISNPFTGGMMKKGGGRQATTRLVGESNLEAQRLARVQRFREQIRAATVPHPPDRSGDHVPIRLDNLKSAPLKPEIRSLVDQAQRKLEEGVKLTKQERQAVGDEFEQVRQSFVMKRPEKMTQDEQAQFQKLHDEGKIGWVNRRLLGGLDQPEPKLESVLSRPVTKSLDAVNNGYRLAVLYLKPAYAAPNILGNAGLNLVHQGFAAPYELARSATLGLRAGADTAARVDQIMGEGFARSLSGHEGIGSKGVQALASVWGKGVDVPFRRASFLFEARRAGFKTPEQLKSLLTDAKHNDELVAIGRRANREIIDYSRLGPREREIVRRVILFYPWVKGSTLYAGRLIAEHPLKAAATSQLGVQGKELADRTLGPRPSYLEGAFGIGGKLVNPASAAILQTPVQAARAVGHVADLLRGGQAMKQEAARLGGLVTPAVGLPIEAATGIDPSTGRPVKSGLGHAFLDQLPQTRLFNAFRHPKGADKLFPDTPASALKQFAVGGIAPRAYSPANLHTLAANEQRAGMSPVERAVDDGNKNRVAFLTAAKKAGALPPTATALPAPLHDAIILRAKRYANYGRSGVRRGSPSYQRDAFKVDINTLVKWKKMPAAEAQQALKWAATASKTEITTARAQLGQDFFGGGELSAATRSLHDAGVTDFAYR